MKKREVVVRPADPRSGLGSADAGAAPRAADSIAVYRTLLEEAQSEWRASGNPLCAWEALHYALGAGLPLPGWVLGYLREGAGELMRIGEPGELSGDAVLRALGFVGRGQGNLFTRYRNLRARGWALRRVGQLLGADPERTEDELFEQVARELAASPFNLDWSKGKGARRPGRRREYRKAGRTPGLSAEQVREALARARSGGDAKEVLKGRKPSRRGRITGELVRGWWREVQGSLGAADSEGGR